MKPKVFIYMEGGLIQEVLADCSIDLMVIDGDLENSDPPDRVHDFKSHPDHWLGIFRAYLYRIKPEKCPAIVKEFFRQKRAIEKKNK